MVTGTAKWIAGEKKRASREETVACEGGTIKKPKAQCFFWGGEGKGFVVVVFWESIILFLPDFPGMGSNYVSRKINSLLNV